METKTETKVQPDSSFGFTNDVCPPYTEQSGYPGPPPQYNPHGISVISGATIVSGRAGSRNVIVEPTMGPIPTPFTCRSCNMVIITRVENATTLRTHLFALLLCIGGCCPCMCVPYCMNTCKNAEHYCPNCNAYIGSYRR